MSTSGETPGDEAASGDAGPLVDEVVVVSRDSRAVVVVRGEIDIATCPPLEAAIAEVVDEGALEVVVDLSEVTFVGSSGLASLLRAQRLLAAHDGRLVLRAPSRVVRDLLEMTHLLDRFTIVDPSA